MSVTQSQTDDCNEHYELKTYAKLFNCDGCKMKGFRERYVCNFCGRELHKECKNPIITIAHEHFPGSVFEFLEEPFMKLDRKKRRIFSSAKMYHFHVHCITEMMHEAFIKHGDLALQNMDLRELVNFNRKRREGGNALVSTIKSFLKILLSVLFGDPTMLVSSVVVVLLSHAMQQ